MADPSDADGRAAVDRAFRSEYGRTVAVLMRAFGDLDLVEDAVQDAFASATATWPVEGVPPNPQAWIVTAARRRAIDRLRRADTARRHATDIAQPDPDAPTDLLDDELRLILLCAHPRLSPEQQVTLTLRFIGGLTVPEIARAFAVSDATISQRLTREDEDP